MFIAELTQTGYPLKSKIGIDRNLPELSDREKGLILSGNTTEVTGDAWIDLRYR